MPFSKMRRVSVFCAAAIVIFLIVASETRASICPTLPASLPTGSCTIYPATGNICSPVIGNTAVYIQAGMSIQILDVVAAKVASIFAINRGIVDEECQLTGDAFMCNSIYLPCENRAPNLAEGIPVLPCENVCNNFWSKCQAAFDAFYVGAILGLGQPIETFTFPHCGPQGTWTVDPQPAEIFGKRNIPGLGPFPSGYLNQTRFPAATAKFRRLDNSLIDVTCATPTVRASAPLDTTGLVDPVECFFPLVEENGECRIPCPFPIIPPDEQDSIGLAFVVPAVIAVFFCAFVLVDSVFVILSSQGFDRYCRPRRLFRRFGSTTDGATSDDAGTGSANVTGSGGGRRRRSVLRAATLYSLLGAILGFIYFVIGPMVTLIRGNEVSCGEEESNLNLLDFVLGRAERSDAFCRAQRIAPFVLQMVFNLILYAIVRVFMVVTEKSRHMSSQQQLIFDTVLIMYCAGIPILFMIISIFRDQLSTSLVDFITQFSRNSAICVPRLTVAEEVILVFLPFIITGTIVTLLSYYIYTHLRLINQNVQGLVGAGGPKSQSSSAVALRLLIVRLLFLGVCTFIILLVFIAASASLMASMNDFSPKFNNFFLCTATQASTCQLCQAELALMLDALPASTAFAAQLAAMSSITLLFGGFFSAQAMARLYKEYQDGSLSLKLLKVFCCKRGAQSDGEQGTFNSFSEMPDGPGRKSFMIPITDVQETCASIWAGRFKRFRQSMRDGRARGPVFRFAKGTGPVKARSPAAFSPSPAWGSSKPVVNESNIQWKGVVGPSSPEPGQWSSSNSSFVGSPLNATRTTPSDTFDYNKDPSWGYSESKLTSTVRGSNAVYDSEASSYARKEQFVKAPPLPDL